MTFDQEQNREGRRALFFGAGAASLRETTIPESEVEQAALQISTMDEEKQLQYPPSLEPVVVRIHALLNKIQDQETSLSDLESQLLLKKELISTLQNENLQLSSERESYLDDLITSHTEFDRALEIFQYHEVPMVLTGLDRTVHDANDAFCTLFSIKRSEITTSHPALDRYFPDTIGIEGPDGEQYAVVSLSPPIVPFDHDTVSLVILIKTASLPIPAEPSVIMPPSWEGDDEATFSSGVPDDTALIAFDAFPIPAAVVNEYHTIILCNTAFCDLLGRTGEITRFRDIGSCGIRYGDAARLTTIVNEQIPVQCDAVITRPDGTDVSVYLTGSPLYSSSSGPMGLIVGLIVSEREDDVAPAPGTSLASGDDLMLQLMLDLNPSAVAFLDKHARVVRSNEGFSELTGLSPTDLTGTDVRDLGVCIPDEIWSLPTPEVRYLSGIIRMESLWGVQELSGIIVPLGDYPREQAAILILQPIEPGASPSSDIGQTTLASEQTAVASTHPEVLPDETLNLDQVPVPVLVADTSGDIILVNAACSLLFNTEPTLIIGKPRIQIFEDVNSGVVRYRTASGILHLREFPGSVDGKQCFWYQDITSETNQISSLERRNSELEDEIGDLRRESGIATARSKNTLEANAQIDIVEFELYDELYAMDIRMVREVVEMQQVTPLPRTPPYVIGIINLRGEVTHIIDLAILLGQRPRKDRSGQKIIIIPSDVTNGEHVGIIVDNVQSVTEIMGRHVSLLGDDIAHQINTHIKGIIKISHDDILEKHTGETGQDASLVIWLDIQKILHDIQGSS